MSASQCQRLPSPPGARRPEHAGHHAPAPNAGRSAIAALAFGLLAVALGADDEGPYGRLVTEIRIEGNTTISETSIRNKLKTRAGRPLDPDVVEGDSRALQNSDWFSHVRFTYREDPERGGVILILRVQEMPILESVEYRGRHSLSEKKLKDSTGLEAGSRADSVRARAAVGQIRRLYEEKGFLQCEVRLLEGGKPGDRKVVFEIFEGPRFGVGEVGFEGNTVFSDGSLRTKIRTKPKILGILGPGYTAEGPEEDARKIVEAYQAIGYFECTCTPVVRHADGIGKMSLTFVVSEGPLYSVRNITFEGNEKIPEPKLREGLVLHSGEPLRDDVRQRDADTLTEKYTAIGCIDINIMPEPRFTDTPGVVDLVYHIEEGEQYILGAININGNDRTRAKVVLRELTAAGLLPGEPLDGRRIETAKKRLTNLKYFNDNPQQGDPLTLQIVNRRGPDQPYGELEMPDLDDLVQARFQAPDDDLPALPPDLPPLPPSVEPLAPGDGPASVVPFGSGGAFEPAPNTIPPIQVPPPTRPAPGLGAGAGRRPAGNYPPPSGSFPGTFPTTPGNNFSDVGPDRNEPYANRSLENIASQVEPRGRSFADLDVNLEEAPTGRVLLGVGATSYGGLNGNLIIHERNFDIFNVPRSFRELLNGQAFRGAGQELRIQLSPGTQINSSIISFREPDLFNRRIGLNISGYAFRRYYPYTKGSLFTEGRVGGRFALGRQFGSSVYADVAARVEDVQITGFDTPAPAEYYAAAGHTFLTTIRPSIHFDNRNDPFLPSSGSYLEAAFEQGFGTFTFPKVTIEGRRHFLLGSRPDGTGKRFVSMRGFFGVTGKDTPVYERFYAGDFRSLRGFYYRGVGPHILGANVGGVFTMLASVEYQFPLTANDMFQMVVFTDTGTVENSYSIHDYRVAVGTGLRVTVPALGPLPLAFDIAFPVVKGPDDRERLFTFFIGAFY